MAGIALMGLLNAFGEGLHEAKGEGTMNALSASEGWLVVNDGVMGGISQSSAVITDDNTLLFSGKVSLENNGGFASIRHDSSAFNIGRGEGIRLRIKGDDKKYQLRVRTSTRFDGIAYKADFSTVKDEWQDVFIPWEKFEPTYHGQLIRNAPELEGGQIRQIGFLIADKQEGHFKLEVALLESFQEE